MGSTTYLPSRGNILSLIFIFLLKFRAGVSLLFVPRDNAANNGPGKAPPISYNKLRNVQKNQICLALFGFIKELLSSNDLDFHCIRHSLMTLYLISPKEHAWLLHIYLLIFLPRPNFPLLGTIGI